MSTLFVRSAPRFVRLAAVALFALGSVSIVGAQMPGAPPGQMGQGIPNQTQMGVSGGMTDQLQYGTIGHGIERDEYNAYQKFLKAAESDKKIKLGNEFLRRYPKSPFVEQVDVGMMNVCMAQKDWKDSYRFGDDALALDPDDVDVLAPMSWAIPHVYDPTSKDASEQLSKAEKYAKHALEVMATLPKPEHMTDEQFSKAKASRSLQAHSALGLVYFRRRQYEDSAKETEQAVQGNPTLDATDLFVLGADLHFLNRHAESADAFSRCAQITSSLQEKCKQNASAEKIQAAQSNAK
jgi:tetratricopeptide (TPR) repeat protein